jgi:hypothetical protein
MDSWILDLATWGLCSSGETLLQHLACGDHVTVTVAALCIEAPAIGTSLARRTLALVRLDVAAGCIVRSHRHSPEEKRETPQDWRMPSPG